MLLGLVSSQAKKTSREASKAYMDCTFRFEHTPRDTVTSIVFGFEVLIFNNISASLRRKQQACNTVETWLQVLQNLFL